MVFLTAGGHDFQDVLHGCNGIFRRSGANEDTNFASLNRRLTGPSGTPRQAYGFRGLKAREAGSRAQSDISSDVHHLLGYPGRG